MKSVFLLSLLSVCALGGEPLTVVTRYEDFTAQGLQANVMSRDGKVYALEVKASDPAKNLPDWMQAFYVVNRDAEIGQPLYEFDQKKPNRVSAFFGWSDTKEDRVLVIGPVLRKGETFNSKHYLAIAVKDLIAWRGPKPDETKVPAPR